MIAPSLLTAVRPPPFQRGHAQPPVREARRAPVRGSRRHVIRGLGAKRRLGERNRRFQRLEQGRAQARAARAVRDLGGLHRRRRARALYKYHVHSRVTRTGADKADPFAVYAEQPPARPRSLGPELRLGRCRLDVKSLSRQQPVGAVVGLRGSPGSWMRVPEEDNRWLTYRELAPRLADYAHRLGFTHVEFMPVMEHPFYGSWGYQCTGYFAPTSRFGTPQDFMFLVDHLHQHGIGVILDWCRPISHPTKFGLQLSMGRTCTSMPTRVWACIRIGAARSSTTGATRCVGSC